MDKYQEAEKRGRDKTTKRFGKRLHIEYTTDQFNRVDANATGITSSNSGNTYVIEIKNYDDPENPRPFTKYDDYMLDHDKVANIKEKAKREGRIPLVIVYFYDYTIVWNVSKIDIDSRANWRWVNKDGQDYGEKELAYETYLYESEILWKEERQETERRMTS